MGQAGRLDHTPKRPAERRYRQWCHLRQGSDTGQHQSSGTRPRAVHKLNLLSVLFVDIGPGIPDELPIDAA